MHFYQHGMHGATCFDMSTEEDTFISAGPALLQFEQRRAIWSHAAPLRTYERQLGLLRWIAGSRRRGRGPGVRRRLPGAHHAQAHECCGSHSAIVRPAHAVPDACRQHSAVALRA